jgi:hypothetical protein
MSRPIWLLPLLLLTIAGCNKSMAVDADGTASRGRYSGIGTFPADPLWRQRTETDLKDESAARLADDSQIIVVVDSQTGEVRQCGNNTGQCVSMNPWSKDAAASSLPAVLKKHAADLDAETAQSTQNVTEAKVKDR